MKDKIVSSMAKSPPVAIGFSVAVLVVGAALIMKLRPAVNDFDWARRPAA